MKYNTTLQRQIIQAWKKTKVIHPSYTEIAKKVGCNRQTVFKIVGRYKLKAGRTQ